MSEKALHQLYYRLPNSAIDKYMPKDCLEKCIYITAKAVYQIPDLIHAFFDDITLCMIQSADCSIKSFEILNSRQKIYFFKLESTVTQGAESAKLLDDLLDSNEIVFIQTVVEKLPFLTMYNPGFDIQQFQPMHTFVIIHHDRENYYYVDAHHNHNPQGFTACKDNPEVGVAPKSVFNAAISHYLKCYTIKPIPENLARMDDEILKRIREIVVNYHRSSERKNGTVLFYGREAFETLIAICESEKMLLTEPVTIANNPITLNQLIRWKIGGDLVCRRRLLYKVLSRYCTKHRIAGTEQFIRNIRNHKDAWEIFTNSLDLKFKKQQYLLDAAVAQKLRKLLAMEDWIVEEMRAIFLRNPVPA